ncbi:MAG: lipase family protein, partial [Pseudomonadota bacterium]
RTDGGMRDALSDLQDDAYMALGWPPKKFAAAKELNQLVLDNLGDEAGDYSFHYTGHSLGAALSDLAATDMALKLQAQKLLTPGKISTITFDNPGSQYLVKKLLAPSGQELSDLKDAVSYISINNKPNFINTMDEQTGDTYYLVPQEQWHTDPLLKLIGFCGKYVPNPALSFLLDIISYGPPEHQIKDHSMVNFVEALVDKLEIAGVGGVDTIIKAGCFDDSYG